MEFKKKFNIEIGLLVEITYYLPDRPAPACSNPSSPAYSDPGDDAELEFVLYTIDGKGKKKEIPEEFHFLYETLYDEIFEKVEEIKDEEYI
ncbi:MAG TPA: hypothetical protein VMX17_01360 [Candidatus Glassbacteria bacterium]|nr:hypothetical protein [Candidatus Glassbacteria bacterium]